MEENVEGILIRALRFLVNLHTSGSTFCPCLDLPFFQTFLSVKYLTIRMILFTRIATYSVDSTADFTGMVVPFDIPYYFEIQKRGPIAPG